MNILMLNPKYPEQTFWNTNEIVRIFERRRATFPPLGLLTIASYLPEEFQIRLIDRNIEEETDDDFRWADIIFISLMAVQMEDYEVCIANAKKQGKPIAVGGPFTHAYPEKSVEDADWVCFGEAESIIEEFVNDLRSDRRGIQYQGGNKTLMEELKPPRFDLLTKINDYSVMPVQFSRGCPFTCEFCDIIEIYGRVPRTKTPDQMIAELKMVKNLDFTGSIFIVDDNFIGNKKKAKEMLKELAAWNSKKGGGYRFLTEASLDLANDDELMKRMAEANMRIVFLGLETPDPKLLKLTKKTQNISSDPLESINKIRANGIHISAGFIIGFDGENRNVFEVQKKFLELSGIGIAMAGFLTAIPHTQLSRRLNYEERLLKKLVSGNQTVSGINFIPKGELTKREYFTNFANYVKEIYEPKAFYKRILPAILNLDLKNNNIKLSFGNLINDLTNFFRQIWVLGFKEKGVRRLYWKTFFKVLFKNPPGIYAFAIDTFYFYHLRRHADYVKSTITNYLKNPDPDDVLDEVIRVDNLNEEKTAASAS